MAFALIFGDDVDAVHLDLKRPQLGGACGVSHGEPPSMVHDCFALRPVDSTATPSVSLQRPAQARLFPGAGRPTQVAAQRARACALS